MTKVKLKTQYKHIAQGEREVVKIWETKRGNKIATFSLQNPEHNYTAAMTVGDAGIPTPNSKILTQIPGHHHKKALKMAGYQPKENQ